MSKRVESMQIGVAVVDELRAEIERLTRERDEAQQLVESHREYERAKLAEVERLKRMSTVEMMCENMNVKHHVEEWENRCLKAEAEVERLKALLRECAFYESAFPTHLTDRIRAALGDGE